MTMDVGGLESNNKKINKPHPQKLHLPNISWVKEEIKAEIIDNLENESGNTNSTACSKVEPKRNFSFKCLYYLKKSWNSEIMKITESYFSTQKSEQDK